MTLTQFKYVLEIAKTGSMNQAAKNLFISQSVVSVAIRALAEELGQKIVSRSNKGICLTPFGQDFVSYITPIHLQVEQLNNMLLHSGKGYTRSLSVASTGYYFLSEVFARLLNKYRSEGLRIDSHDVSNDVAMQMLYNRSVEIGFIRRWSCYNRLMVRQLRSLDLDFFPIASLNVGVTVGPNNPLYYSKSDYVKREALRDFPCIMYCYLDTGPYADIFDRLKVPVSPNRVVTESRATLYEIIRATDAYYLDSIYISDPQQTMTSTIPTPRRTLMLADCSIKSEFGWLKRKNDSCTPIEQEVIEAVTEMVTSGYA